MGLDGGQPGKGVRPKLLLAGGLVTLGFASYFWAGQIAGNTPSNGKSSARAPWFMAIKLTIAGVLMVSTGAAAQARAANSRRERILFDGSERIIDAQSW